MDVKQISITGSAVNDYIGGGKKTRRKHHMNGGSNNEYLETNATPVNKQSALAQKININKTNISTPQQPPQQPITIQQTSLTNVNNTQQQGGTLHKPKVIIAPKQKTRKVILAPKHNKKTIIGNKKIGHRTLRRVSLPISAVKTKIAKTRKHIKESQLLPIDKIRKELISAKLLNPDSKAPDILLRKIYADVKIIGNN
jgi:hypothetical protein